MHVLLDTDIGTDVDDALALGVILGSPELNLVGITTVYGDTVLRARLAARLGNLTGLLGEVPVVPGEQTTRSGRAVWWPGHEGRLQPDLEKEGIDQTQSAAAFLSDMARRYHGELSVLAVGPLTNIAKVLDEDPQFERNVARLIVMGGDFSPSDPASEHNFVSDVAAAQRVFASGLKIVVGGLDVTTQIKIGPDLVAAMAQAGPFGSALEAEINGWWAFHGHSWNNPHDPILAAWLVHPELFQSHQSQVRIDDQGISHHQPLEDGPVTVLTAIDADRVGEQIVSRICNAGARPLLAR